MGDNKKGLDISSALGTVGGIATGIIGSLTQKKREERAMKNQMKLNEQGQELAVKTWNETNAEAQRKHYEDAGLSVGLMYGGSGAGGTATSGSGGSAPQPQQLDIASATQVALMNAQREKIEAETANIRGEEGTIGESQINKLRQDIKESVQKEGLNLQQALKTGEEITELSRNNQIKGEDYDMVRREWVANIYGKEIENQLNNKKIKLTETQKKELEHRIWQNWVKTGASAIKDVAGTVGGALKAFVSKK